MAYRQYFEDKQVQRDWIKVRKALKGLIDSEEYVQFGFAAYLFYNHYHSGMYSDFYRMQCSLDVTYPAEGLENELRNDLEMQMIYNALEELYGFPLTAFEEDTGEGYIEYHIWEKFENKPEKIIDTLGFEDDDHACLYCTNLTVQSYTCEYFYGRVENDD